MIPAQELERYYWIKMNQLQRLESILNRHGRSLQTFDSVLDFGCGFGIHAGRILSLNPNAQIFGCDVSPECMTICRTKYPKGHFVVSGATPPLPFADRRFDFIFSYSVFTHLPELIHQHWLKELARILNCGGVMAHTIHSLESLKRMAQFSPEALDKYELPGGVEEFLRSQIGYHYTPDNSNASHPEFGLSVIRKEYVLQHWPQYSGLRIVDYAESAIESYPEGCQDLVLLSA